jgi:hypothetical protein
MSIVVQNVEREFLYFSHTMTTEKRQYNAQTVAAKPCNERSIEFGLSGQKNHDSIHFPIQAIGVGSMKKIRALWLE